MPSQVAQQRVLIAGTEDGVRLVADVLGADCDIVTARSVRDALHKVRDLGPFPYVVCNIRFDESRMFDFLEALRTGAPPPAPRVVCVHASPPPLSPGSRPAIEAALEALGVQALVDFPALARTRGAQAARQVLRTVILFSAAGRP